MYEYVLYREEITWIPYTFQSSFSSTLSLSVTSTLICAVVPRCTVMSGEA